MSERVTADDEGDGPLSDRELEAERAFKTQIFAFLIWPLQLVALIFIISVAVSDQRLQGRSRRRYRIALALHLVVWFVLFSIPIALSLPTFGR